MERSADQPQAPSRHLPAPAFLPDGAPQHDCVCGAQGPRGCCRRPGGVRGGAWPHGENDLGVRGLGASTLILKAYRKAGYDVECLEDIRRLGLDLDQIRPVRPHLKIAYSSAAAAEGAFSGVVASGGSIAAVLGLGVASAPGIALTASVVALDIATFLGAATRLVSHTAAYYGYDTVDPAENLFATMVLSQAIDPESAGEGAVVEKQTTMIAFNKVMRDVAKRGPMDSVGTNVFSAAINSLVASLGARLASLKIAQIIPFIGIIVGAFVNASLMRTIGDTADHLYRERFLAERYGYIDEAGEDSTGVVSSQLADEISADIASYVELTQTEGRSR